MMQLPQRKLYASREDFAAAHFEILSNLLEEYNEVETAHASPEWAERGVGKTAFNVTLPLAIIGEDRAVRAAVNSILNRLIEKGKSIKQLAHVEQNGTWTLWVETD